MCAKVVVLVELAPGSDPKRAAAAAEYLAQGLRFTPGVKQVWVLPLPEEASDVG